MAPRQAVAVAETVDKSLAERLRAVFVTHDLELVGTPLADDFRWGDDEHPRRCRGRSDVLGAFSRLMGVGVVADITEMATGTSGLLCHLRVTFPKGVRGLGDHDLFQVYTVSDDRITEIQRFNDRHSAIEAAGVSV